jgi:hypothetical protein
VVICGSRTWPDPERVWSYVDELPGDCTVIVGGAHGADMFAEERARWRGLAVEVFKADWEQYGRRAGLVRNLQMLDFPVPDRVVAFWDGQSRGTRHTIRIARQRKIPVEIIFQEGP